MTSEQAFNKVPEHGWTCFHCGEHFAPTFGGQQAARHHFGESPIEQPACTIDARAFRAMQDLCARYQSEDTELHREIQRLQADHAVALRREEEKGYARGVQDARAMPPVEPSGRQADDGHCPECAAYIAEGAPHAWKCPRERHCVCGLAVIPEGELRMEVGPTTHRLAGPCFQTSSVKASENQK